MNTRYLLFSVLVLLAGCAGNTQQFIVSDSYSEIDDTTTLTILPYGNVVIPGLWEKIKKSNSSYEHWFRNADSTVILITLALPSNYEVYDGSKSAFENLYAHYKWESDYVKEAGRKVVEIHVDREKNFVLWSSSIGEAYRLSLYGLKSDRLYKLAIDKSNWFEAEQREFLIDLYERN